MLGSCLSTMSGDNLRTYIVAGKHGVCPWILRGKNAGVGSHSLLQGIFPTRNWTWVSCTAGGLFIIRATREALLSQHRPCCIITVFPRLPNWGQEACLVSCPRCQINHPACGRCSVSFHQTNKWILERKGQAVWSSRLIPPYFLHLKNACANGNNLS